MKNIHYAGYGLAVLFASVSPALAGKIVPAPLLGAGLPGLAILGLAGGGYLLVKHWKRRG